MGKTSFKKRNVSSIKWECNYLGYGSRNQSRDKYCSSKITETKTHLQGLVEMEQQRRGDICMLGKNELWVRDLFHQGGEIFVSVA